nr:MAG: hypothetical protein [Bacteriophage sp.]UWG84475.1 MAG: hypothetical protein [Bacteriophage sp.]
MKTNSEPLVNKNKMKVSSPLLKSNEVVIINTGEFGSISISKERIKKELNKPFEIGLR